MARAVLVVALLVTSLTVAPSPARAQPAGIGLGVSPASESPVVVGAQSKSALIQFVNNSFGAAALTPVTVSNILVNPACADSFSSSGPSPCGSPEPRPTPAQPILDLDATSSAGTTCSGGPFVITGPDAEGDYAFAPSNGQMVLAPVGQPGSSCVIRFTFDVLQRPLDGATSQVVVAVASSPDFFPGAPQSGVSQVTVNQAGATIATQASPSSTTVGSSISDTATVTGVAGAAAPTGNVTFRLHGPNDTTCAGSTIFQSVIALGPASPTSATASSGAFVPTQPGVYRYVGVYSGDANYAPASGACGDPSETVTVTAAPVDRPVNDFDANGTTDVAVFRPATSTWYLRTPSPSALVWGEPVDIPVPGDYDGNGTTDIAVFRPATGTWYLRTANPTAIVWGQSGDIPVPGDYDGNGTTDLAVYRPSTNTWYLRTTSPTAVVWGQGGDVPVPGDYDGNGTTDIAVFRPANGTWFLRTASPSAIVWGQTGDVPQPGDYDGDGTTDLAVFRPGNNTWYLRTTSPSAVVWGQSGDRPLSLPDAIARFFF